MTINSSVPRVLMLFTSSEIGGAERSLTRMAVHGDGHTQYSLATCGPEGAWSAWARSLGAQPQALTAEGTSSVLRALPRLFRLWWHTKPDIIYVMGLRAAIAVRLARFALPKTKIVHGIRANLELDNKFGRQHKFFESWLKGTTDFYITNANITKQQLSALANVPDHKITAIYNGVDAVKTTPAPMSARPLDIVCVANLAPRKGHLEFLDVVQRIAPKFPQLKVHFIGRDDMNGKVQAKIRTLGLEHMVQTHGYVAAPEKFVGNARLMVLPSLWGEGCPTSVLEALAQQTPVVAYAIDGLPELVTHGTDGFLAPPHDANVLQHHIEFLLGDAALAQSFGRAGEAKIEQHFGLAECARQHGDVWQQLLVR